MYHRPLIQRILRRAFPGAFFRWFYRQNGRRMGSRGGKGRFTLSFDVELRLDTKSLGEVQKRLDVEGIRASFACIGQLVEEEPGPYRSLVAGGHEILNHSWSHPHHPELHPHQWFEDLTDADLDMEITRGDESLTKLLGVKPLGFRTPHFGRSHTPRVYPVLARRGYRYSTSTVATYHPGYGAPWKGPSGIYEVPLATYPSMPFLCIDTYSGLRSHAPLFAATAPFVAEIDQLLGTLGDTGGWASIYFDPEHTLASGVLEGVIQAIRKHKDRVDVLPYRDLPLA